MATYCWGVPQHESTPPFVAHLYPDCVHAVPSTVLALGGVCDGRVVDRAARLCCAAGVLADVNLLGMYTYKLALFNVDEAFEGHKQRWNENYAAAQAIFRNSLMGINPTRTMILTQHKAMYMTDGNTTYGVCSNAVEFFTLLNWGRNQDIQRSVLQPCPADAPAWSTCAPPGHPHGQHNPDSAHLPWSSDAPAVSACTPCPQADPHGQHMHQPAADVSPWSAHAPPWLTICILLVHPRTPWLPPDGPPQPTASCCSLPRVALTLLTPAQFRGMHESLTPTINVHNSRASEADERMAFLWLREGHTNEKCCCTQHAKHLHQGPLCRFVCAVQRTLARRRWPLPQAREGLTCRCHRATCEGCIAHLAIYNNSFFCGTERKAFTVQVDPIFIL
jgi:hypothetical protein